MGLQEWMMRRWMKGKTAEQMASMMSGMMGKMSRDMGPQEMRAMMKSMMPAMMERCFAGASSEGMVSTMHEMMPRMMDRCFSKMDTPQRQQMLVMCREMLDQMEARYKAPVPSA